MKAKRNNMVGRSALVLLLILLCSIAVMMGCASPEEDIEWDVTLVGDNGEQQLLGYDEIKAMPAYTGRGGFITTVGTIYGPYDTKGVLIEDVCDLVGGLTPSDVVMVSATDGYSMVFDYEQVMGDINTHDPVSLKEVPHGELRLILMYEQDGNPLSDSDGKPLRLAVVGTDDLLTEGHYWVKWVDKVEVKRKAQID